MAERIVKIGTPQETLQKFAKEALQNSFFSKYIGERDTALVADALIEAGFMQRGDTLAVTFETDTLIRSDTMTRKAKIFTARKTSDGKLVPTSFLGEFELDIECSNDN